MINSKRTSLILLAVTALAFSRGTLALFNDPEGPNLLVVLACAAIIFVPSWVVYGCCPSVPWAVPGRKRLALAFCVQLLVTAISYCLLG